jgi:hypothetical protein
MAQDAYPRSRPRPPPGRSLTHREVADPSGGGRPIGRWPTHREVADPSGGGRPIGRWPTHREVADPSRGGRPIGRCPTHREVADPSRGGRPIGRCPTHREVPDPSGGDGLMGAATRSPGRLLNRQGWPPNCQVCTDGSPVRDSGRWRAFARVARPTGGAKAASMGRRGGWRAIWPLPGPESMRETADEPAVRYVARPI